ncbi:Ataxin 2-like, partial [Perkinsus olseni]
KGGKGKGVKGGKGGGLPAPISAPQGSPQGGPFQGGAAAAGHQPSQLMMNAVHNAQNAQMQQQDAGKPPVGKGGAGVGRKNLTLDSTQSVGPKRSGFSFNPNANTFTPSTAGVPTQGATLNINVTPGGSLSGTLKNVNYDGYDAASAAAADQQQQQGPASGPASAASAPNKQQQASGGSTQTPQGRQQQQQQQEQYQAAGGRGGPSSSTSGAQGGPPLPPLPPHGAMMGPGMIPGGAPPMGMMIPMPPHAAAYPGIMAAAAAAGPMPLPNITPPSFVPLCDDKSLDESTLGDVMGRLLDSCQNENTSAVSTDWPDGSKSSSYRDIISASATAAAAAPTAAAPMVVGPAIASGQGGAAAAYMPIIPGQPGPHMMQP